MTPVQDQQDYLRTYLTPNSYYSYPRDSPAAVSTSICWDVGSSKQIHFLQFELVDDMNIINYYFPTAKQPTYIPLFDHFGSYMKNQRIVKPVLWPSSTVIHVAINVFIMTNFDFNTETSVQRILTRTFGRKHADIKYAGPRVFQVVPVS